MSIISRMTCVLPLLVIGAISTSVAVSPPVSHGPAIPCYECVGQLLHQSCELIEDSDPFTVGAGSCTEAHEGGYSDCDIAGSFCTGGTIEMYALDGTRAVWGLGFALPTHVDFVSCTGDILARAPDLGERTELTDVII